MRNSPKFTPQQPLAVSMRVANAMERMGVSGLPRNYEIFYGAITGAISELKSELLERKAAVTQEVLDTLYEQYCLRSDDEALISRICSAVDGKLNETITRLSKEQVSASQYGRLLSQTTQKLKNDPIPQPTMLNKIVHVLSDATEATQKQNEVSLNEIKAGSNELVAMQLELTEYKKLAETDALSGLFNRRAFDETLSKIGDGGLGRSALIIGDIDKFKVLNDTYGHPFGDLVIRKIAKLIQQNCREKVLIARVGGEEFAILSDNIDEEGMMRLAERLCVIVAESSFGNDRTRLGPGKVTISFGVCHSSVAATVTAMYSQADEALYCSKRAGRNQVTSYKEMKKPPTRKKLYLYER